jgi:hypothetical protein
MITLATAPAVAPAPENHPKTYLLSIARVPFKAEERMTKFSLKTWGVTFDAVCHIPYGWQIQAGGGVTSEGELEGKGSNGVTWVGKDGLRQFDDLVLITLYAPIQARSSKDATGEVPATFSGTATLWADDAERPVYLGSGNIRLTPASRCPTLPSTSP